MSPKTDNDLFSIRQAYIDDMPGIRYISDDVDMPVIESTVNTFVAVNYEDIPIGFIRIKLLDAKGDTDEEPGSRHAFVYPVAVLSSWQGYDVGTALIDVALEKFGELRLVACTPSQGFYRRLDFKEASWDQIAPEIARDCNRCSSKDTCTPQPFIKRRQ